MNSIRNTEPWWLCLQRHRFPRQWAVGLAFWLCLAAGSTSAVGQDKLSGEATSPTYEQVQQVLTTYCAGCHNNSDREGDLSLVSFESTMAGKPDEEIIFPGKPDASKLFQVISGAAEPKMPPEDEKQISTEAIELIRRWILSGATGPVKSAHNIDIPEIRPAKSHYVTAACLAHETKIALGMLGKVELRDRRSDQLLWQVGTAGKVNSLRVAPNRNALIVGSGRTGLDGQILVVDLSTGNLLQQLNGHSDAVYCASMSPDGNWIASGSYDRKVIMWNVHTGQPQHTLTGHNGAIYDLDFSPSSEILGTASADQTIKLWHVPSGKRLDTLGQPGGEMACVRFSPNGQAVFGAGADRQIRKWQILSTDRPMINPMLHATYAHEADVLQLEFVGNELIASASKDRTVRLWRTNTLESAGQLSQLSDDPVALLPSQDSRLLAVELGGTVHELAIDKPGVIEVSSGHAELAGPPTTSTTGSLLTNYQEHEPNDSSATAMLLSLPATVQGNIKPAVRDREDIDLYRFTAQKGSQWIFEVSTDRNVSRLDSAIEILDSDGRAVLRTRMQALRESYFTFRGKDSSTSDDFRLHQWEDMELDEYLYSNGEITKLWMYPRGPDSGFKVYPGSGSRYTYFGSTPITHALGESAFVVRELASGEPRLSNGLPVFPVYFENDDDPLRRAGPDSWLDFVAPQSGDYFVRLRDARGFGGDDFSYTLSARVPQPDFAIEVSGNRMDMPIGSGREWQVKATRLDGLDAPISIHLQGLPVGFLATNPLIIEAGQEIALGTIFATQAAAVRPQTSLNAEQLADADSIVASNKSTPGEATDSAPLSAIPAQAGTQSADPASIRLIAECQLANRKIVHELEQTLDIRLTEKNEVQLELVDARDASQPLTELNIRPGQTVRARVIVQRHGAKGPISFGKEDSGRNLPHGAFVDNIGLSGLLIPEPESEREFFITAAPKVSPGRRQFHLRTESKGNATSCPIWLNVLADSDTKLTAELPDGE
ncbi:MAG: hypothetical protein KDB22_24280 [Planctomycetales bacterium]|nr:hypothetical protein [Planctomycetales bacterium]